MKLEFIPIKTRIVMPPKDEIWDILDSLKLVEGDIVFITSKILGIHQGRCIKAGDAKKEDLIRQESTRMMSYLHARGFSYSLTVTDNILIPNAGIDESNANGHYILWPKNVDGFCSDIRQRLKKKFGLKELGVVSTDSSVLPLRWGVIGITTGFAGITPIKDITQNEDIFGRKPKVTHINLIDPLTSIAVLLMGEGSEKTPIIILRGYKGIEFDEGIGMKDFLIEPDMDIYGPLLNTMEKTKK